MIGFITKGMKFSTRKRIGKPGLDLSKFFVRKEGRSTFLQMEISRKCLLVKLNHLEQIFIYNAGKIEYIGKSVTISPEEIVVCDEDSVPPMENKSLENNEANKSLNGIDENKSLKSADSVNRLELEKDTIGTFWMLAEHNECYNQEITSYVVELPISQHKRPEVVLAKKAELKNLEDYATFQEVEDVGQDRISSRWVVTMKEDHDGQKTKFKARLVARGFQEQEQTLCDSPTVLRESNKLFTAVAANEGFNILSIDIRAAFLQSKELKRDVYVIPPKDVARQGYLWKLNKPLYGLSDASGRFWLRVK